MTGPVEEAGKVAGGVVSALGSQPAVLALIVANLAMLVFLFYAANAAGKFRDDMLRQQFEYQHKVSDLLSRCVVPNRSALELGKPITEQQP
jgi:hypothetical protein